MAGLTQVFTLGVAAVQQGDLLVEGELVEEDGDTVRFGGAERHVGDVGHGGTCLNVRGEQRHGETTWAVVVGEPRGRP